jgi:tetratricopeptide (TPR) repeat protein
MKLLIPFALCCALAIGLVVWRVAASGVVTSAPAPTAPTPPPPDLPDVESLAQPPLPTETAAPAPIVAEDLPDEPEGTLAEPATELTEPAAALPLAPPDATLPPPAPEPAVRWAGERSAATALNQLAAAREVLALDPDHPQALRDELTALRTLQRWAEAADTLARLRTLEPNRPDYARQHAEMLLRLGCLSSTVAPLDEYLALKPDDVEAWTWLAGVRQALGHLGEAERCWTRVLTLRPDDAHAATQRGHVRLELHDWAPAADDFRRASQLDPQSVAPALGRATALFQLGRPDEAMQCLLEIHKAHPRNVLVMNRLAELNWRIYREHPAGRRANLAATIAWCRESLKLDPDQPPIQTLLETATQEHAP